MDLSLKMNLSYLNILDNATQNLTETVEKLDFKLSGKRAKTLQLIIEDLKRYYLILRLDSLKNMLFQVGSNGLQLNNYLGI